MQWVGDGLRWERRKDKGVFCGVLWGEGPGDSPVLEEEEGRRWLSRTETLDSRLWDRLETEEANPGLWRESREEDKPSPNRGDNGKKRRGEGKYRRRVRRR